MALYGKLETDVEIRASAEKFHEIIHQRPHHMSNICSDKIQGVELHAGEWGKVGTILYWRYVHGLFINITYLLSFHFLSFISSIIINQRFVD